MYLYILHFAGDAFQLSYTKIILPNVYLITPLFHCIVSSFVTRMHRPSYRSWQENTNKHSRIGWWNWYGRLEQERTGKDDQEGLWNRKFGLTTVRISRDSWCNMQCAGSAISFERQTRALGMESLSFFYAPTNLVLSSSFFASLISLTVTPSNKYVQYVQTLVSNCIELDRASNILRELQTSLLRGLYLLKHQAFFYSFSFLVCQAVAR